MEKIKYHEWGKEPNEYGLDHALTDNWNPDADYGNEYVNVYFNVIKKVIDNNDRTRVIDIQRKIW